MYTPGVAIALQQDLGFANSKPEAPPKAQTTRQSHPHGNALRLDFMDGWLGQVLALALALQLMEHAGLGLASSSGMK